MEIVDLYDDGMVLWGILRGPVEMHPGFMLQVQ